MILTFFYFLNEFNSLPRDGVHLRADERRRDAFRVTRLLGGSHRIVHLRLQPARTFRCGLGVGRMFGQHPVRRQVQPRVRGRRRERARHPLHDEPAQQRSRSSGEFFLQKKKKVDSTCDEDGCS